MFFDFGGTLFSYRRVGGGTGRLIGDAVRRLGVAAEPARIGSAYRDATRDAYLALQDQPYYLHRELFADTWRRFALGLGSEPRRDWVEGLIDLQRQIVTESFELRDDCAATLEKLRAGGLHVAVVSNIDDDYLDPMIARAGLAELLDDWTSSEEAASCKPHEAIYRFACAKAGVRPEQVLFVGDSPEQDIAGARAVGMTTALLREAGAAPPGSGVGTAGLPHFEIAELAEVLRLALE
ncbi:MAG TPA: HAD family hydrolase [Myxococcota bacterium]|nr:HAD family hydrolase [Myxococcota bacterium]